MSNIIVLKINKKLCGIYDSEKLAITFIKTCLNCNFINKNDNILLQFYQINSFILNYTKVVDLNNDKIDDLNNDKLDDLNNDKCADLNNDKLYDLNNDKCADLNNDKLDDLNNVNNIYEDFSDSDSEVSSIDANEFLKERKKEKDIFNKFIDLGQQKIDIQAQINKLNLDKKKIDDKKNKYDYDIVLFEKFKKLKKENSNFEIPDLFINKFLLFLQLEENNDLNFEAFIDNYIDETLKTSYFDLFESSEYAYKLPTPENFTNENIDELKNIAF
jgi:hypothetical protein